MSETILWGVRLSPFFLKLEACLNFHSMPYKRLPAEGTTLENLRFMTRLERAKYANQIKSFPAFDHEFDEHPSVPYLRTPSDDLMCDSTGIAKWLDHRSQTTKLYPERPKDYFIASLIEEAFDEFGLYMVHHMRWVGSAKSNEMGTLLGKEFSTALPFGGHKLLANSFPKRQVRRCPYLFSVAPENYRAGVKQSLTPPSKAGFPETHSLLFTAWKRYLDALEQILSKQAYVLGDTFTIADAAIYGQFAMNLVDREAADIMLQRAPKTYNWLVQIQHLKHCSAPTALPTLDTIEIQFSDELSELLNCIMGTFCALMVQNEKAYIHAKEQGETLFNEPAFDQGTALYEGRLLGFPFKSVVKTFQVKVWRQLKQQWIDLNEEERNSVRSLIEASELFDS